MAEIRNKKGQVVIWVIIAMALVGSMILFFTLERKPTILNGQDFSPESFIQGCSEKAVNEAVDLMLPQGGFVSPNNTILFNNINVAYLCENQGFYKSCINQHPALINELRSEIKKYIMPKIENCFSNLKSDVERKNSDITLGNMEIDVNLGPNRVILNIDRKVTISKDSETKTFENFEINVINSIYDIANVAIEIASQEAKYCYFEYVGYSVLHTRFGIRKTSDSNSNKIYTIKDKYSDKEMNIAIRSCAIPPGI